MKRSQIRGSVGLVAGALLFLGCGDGKSPVQPTPPVAPELSTFSLSGYVVDTAYRPLGGSNVQVVAGPRAGMATTTDEAGRFSMPGTFTGTVTVTASRDGYLPETRAIPPPNVPLPPLSEGGRWEAQFYLAPIGPSADIAGVYTLTFTADSACTNLPAVARTRSYTATIVPDSRSHFHARLSDARFFSTSPCPPGRPPETCTYNQFGIGIAGDYAGIGIGIVEQLGEAGYLVFEAGAEGSFGAIGITAPLNGSVEYCPGEPYLIDQGDWACPGSAGVQCDSRNHQFALVRR
jgi:hypothetical protein